MGKNYTKRDQIRHLMELSLKAQLNVHEQEVILFFLFNINYYFNNN